MNYLIVDDDASCRKSFVRLVRTFDYDAIAFDNTPELFTWNRDNTPGIVQVDGLEGACFHVIDRLRQHNPHAHYFICSASTDSAIPAQAAARQLPFIPKMTLCKYLERLATPAE